MMDIVSDDPVKPPASFYSEELVEFVTKRLLSKDRHERPDMLEIMGDDLFIEAISSAVVTKKRPEKKRSEEAIEQPAEKNEISETAAQVDHKKVIVVENMDDSKESLSHDCCQPPKLEDVVEAASKNDVAKVAQLIETYPKEQLISTNTWANEETPLHSAAKSDRNIDVIKFLWPVMGDAFSKTMFPKHACMPIHVASLHNAIGVIDLLLIYDPTLIDCREGKWGRNCLHIAASRGFIDQVALLVEKHQADVFVKSNAQDYECMPIHLAAYYDRLQVVQFWMATEPRLVEARSGIDEELAIHSAARGGNITIVDWLLSHGWGDANKSLDRKGWTVLHHAVCGKSIQLVKLLVNKYKADLRVKSNTDDGERLPIHVTVQNYRSDTVQFLLEKDCHLIMANDGSGQTIRDLTEGLKSQLQVLGVEQGTHSLTKKHSPTFDEAQLNKAKKLLVAVQLDDLDEIEKHFVDDQNEFPAVEIWSNFPDGESPLIVAAKSNRYLESVRLLWPVFGESTSQVVNNDKLTAVHVAALNNAYETLDFMLKANSSLVNLEDATALQRTPLHHACAAGCLESVKLIVERHNKGTKDLLFAKSSSIHDSGSLPVHLAAAFGHQAVVAYLISHNKHLLTAEDVNGKSPLHRAACQGKTEAVEYFLEECGQSVELRDAMNGRTVLHWAADGGHLELVCLLVEKFNANGHALSSGPTKFTPLQIASINAHIYVTKYLLNKFPDSLALK